MKKIIEDENIFKIRGTVMKISPTVEVKTGTNFCFLTIRTIEKTKSKYIENPLVVKIYNGLVNLVKEQLKLKEGSYLHVDGAMRNWNGEIELIGYRLEEIKH